MSLRARILLLVVAASLLPMLATIWLVLEYRAATGAQAREQLMARTDAIADDLDDRIAGTAQLLFGLGRVPVVGSEDKVACSNFLADVLREHPQYTGLLTINPNGMLHCDSLQSGRQLDLNDRAYFQQAKKTSKPVVEAVVGRLTGKGVLQIAYPVRAADGTLRFVLLASLDMDAYGQSLAAAFPYQRMHFQMWNRDGSVVMDYPGPGAVRSVPDAAQRALMTKSDHNDIVTLGQGREAILWVRTLLPHREANGLRLALWVPEVDFYAAIDGQFKRALAGVALVSVAIFLIAALLGEFALRRQAGRLMQAISRLDGGDYRPSLGAPYPRGELGEVMQALDRMAHSLAEQQAEIQRNTQALEHQARVDALTGLANRYLLADRLDQALIHARRHQRVVGVLMLDLDRFKTVNDSLGHSQGDVLLKAVADRLSRCVREGDTVARLGGDEFVVVLADMDNANDIAPIAQHILDALGIPVALESRLLPVNTSIGIATYPRDGDQGAILLQYADTAMYRAKAKGGNAMAYYRPEMMQSMMDRLHLEAGLRRALAEGELHLVFQPIIDSSNGRIVAAEALLRWLDPEAGLISPLQCIPVAEETGLIMPIGEWVLHQACLQARAWQAAGFGDIPVAVNLSARQFNTPTLADTVVAALEATQCPASLLQLELTESSIIDQVDQAQVTMARLTGLGIQLAIDDFGTGYSSLSLLKRFPLAKLKIDRAFVHDIRPGNPDDVIVDVVIAMAHKLGLRAVAEGVETPFQKRYLEERHCDELQGFLISAPCSADDFAELVRQRNPRGSGAT